MLRILSQTRFNAHHINFTRFISRSYNFLESVSDNQQQRPLLIREQNKKEYGLRDFIKSSSKVSEIEIIREEIPYVNSALLEGDGRKIYFDVYGCQMNVSDAEVALAILEGAGYEKTTKEEDADVVLLVTCAIRDNAEKKIWGRIKELTKLRKSRMLTEGKLRPKIGVLGCMAERLKEELLEKDRSVDLVAGPDSYRDLPRLLSTTRSYRKAVNVLLSLDETYADVMPVRLHEEYKTAFVSIMRGCNNMCAYCIVPFTRGRERSRPIDSILQEVEILSEQGIKEVTLLGQNVNSYNDTHNASSSEKVQIAKGFKTVYKLPKIGINFAELLDRIADVDPEMRIRFTSPHPKDFPDEVLEVIRNKHNVCQFIHLPAQSGNNEVLERMRRGYTREAYIDLVNRMREYLPRITFSSDFILGFCGETEEQYQDTLSLVETVRYIKAFVFAYSLREKTTAHRRYEDDVPRDVKYRRVAEVMDKVKQIIAEQNKQQVGEYHLVLVEGNFSQEIGQLVTRNESHQRVLIPKGSIPTDMYSPTVKEIEVGDYICVQINCGDSFVLRGTPLCHTKLQDFYKFLANVPTNDLLRTTSLHS